MASTRVSVARVAVGAGIALVACLLLFGTPFWSKLLEEFRPIRDNAVLVQLSDCAMAVDAEGHSEFRTHIILESETPFAFRISAERRDLDALHKELSEIETGDAEAIRKVVLCAPAVRNDRRFMRAIEADRQVLGHNYRLAVWLSISDDRVTVRDHRGNSTSIALFDRPGAASWQLMGVAQRPGQCCPDRLVGIIGFPMLFRTAGHDDANREYTAFTLELSFASLDEDLP